VSMQHYVEWKTATGLRQRVASSGMLRRVALVRTDVSEKFIASIINVTGIGELRTLAVIRNRRTHFVILLSLRRLLVTALFPVHRFLSP
jgi:hypothetical protein